MASPLGRFAAILLGLALALTGCSSDPPKPKPLPSESSSPTPAAPSPPVVPEAAKQKNEAGVRAAVEAFVNAKAFAGNTGNTEVFESLYTDECSRCAGATKAVKETYGAGGRYINAGWTIRSFKLKGIEAGVAYVELLVDTQANSWVPKSGAPAQEFPAQTNYPEFLQLRWSADGWKVAAWNPTS